MIIVLNWGKRSNQRIIDKSFQKILDTINRMNKIKAKNSPNVKTTKLVEP